MLREGSKSHRGRPPLFVFCGVPGSGKTTIARRLSERLRGAVHIQTDVVRAMIAHPNYGGAESSFVYDSCVQIAKAALGHGRPVMLDGTFARRAHRARAFGALRGLYGHSGVVRVVCSMETAIARNMARGAMVPEDRLRGIFASFEEPARALRIDTDTLSPEAAVATILETVG